MRFAAGSEGLAECVQAEHDVDARTCACRGDGTARALDSTDAAMRASRLTPHRAKDTSRGASTAPGALRRDMPDAAENAAGAGPERPAPVDAAMQQARENALGSGNSLAAIGSRLAGQLT